MGESPIILGFFGDAFDRIAIFDPFGTDQKKDVSTLAIRRSCFADPFTNRSSIFSLFLALLSFILLLFLYVGVFFWAIHFLPPPPSQRRRMREWREREPPKKVGGN